MRNLLASRSGRVLAPLAWAYGRVIAARNARFNRGIGVHRMDRPVISVGNITVGGTGKTPLVMWIVEQLRSMGHRPVIALRGYGAERGSYSDEELEYLDRFEHEVPVVANPDRVSALRCFFEDESNQAHDIVVLDDGFQHRRIHRDLDLVVIDATQNTFADRLLPAGRLREPSECLRRASAVIVTRWNELSKSELTDSIKSAHGKPPVALTSHVWTGLSLHEGGSAIIVGPEWLRGRKVVTMFGVGNPRSVSDEVSRQGAEVVASIGVRDHQPYDPAFVRNRVRPLLQDATDGIIVTHKDWVKLRNLPEGVRHKSRFIVPCLSIQFHEGFDALQSLLDAAVDPRANHTGAPAGQSD